jgi:hypothetical protein
MNFVSFRHSILKEFTSKSVLLVEVVKNLFVLETELTTKSYKSRYSGFAQPKFYVTG